MVSHSPVHEDLTFLTAQPQVKGLIVFAHGNSFPGGSYCQLLRAWSEQGWDVMALDRLGHDPIQKISSNWPELVRQTRDFAQAASAHWQALGRHRLMKEDSDSAKRPILVGHSLGGILSLMVALHHPQWARAVLMLDSPFLSGWKAWGVQLAKTLGWMPKITAGQISAKRRQTWVDLAEARSSFASKPMFARWPAPVLEDYLLWGMANEKGVALARLDAPGTVSPIHLRFDRDVETQIYNTLPHHIARLLAKQARPFPVGFVAGTESKEMGLGGMAGPRALAGPWLSVISGGHLYPMESPLETAQVSLELLDRMVASL